MPHHQERASLKDPARHFDKYFSEPVDLGYPDEPVNCPAPDEQDISVKVYQPDDVVVRPSSPAIDYSFRGGLDPGVGGIGMFIADFSHLLCKQFELRCCFFKPNK